MISLRRKLTLSLRGLMVLILGLAVWLGWVVNKAREQKVAVATILKHGGSVRYDWSGPPTKMKSDRTPPGPPWLRRMIGDDFFQEVVYVNLVYSEVELSVVTPGLRALGALKQLEVSDTGFPATDETCKDVETCTSLEVLTMSGPEIIDEGFARLKGLTKLKMLRVDKAALGDKSLENVGKFPSLMYLGLHGTGFTEKGFAHLEKLNGLNFLSIEGSPKILTEAELAHLKKLDKLERLVLPRSKITDEGATQIEGMARLKSLLVGKDSLSVEARKRLKESRPELMIFP